MKIGKREVLLSLSVLVFSSLIGCVQTATPVVSTQGPAAKVTQGAVSGATVWADSLTSGTPFVIDSDEEVSQTTTDSNGNFTLPAEPSYKYLFVSQGGTDTITGFAANTMLAPAGAKSVSPLTTLVALDTSGKIESAINAILPAGRTYDEDITAAGALTPAALVVVNSIESAVTSSNKAILSAATSSGAVLTQQQQNDIDMIMYSDVASTLSSLSPADLANTRTLATSLQSSLANAFVAVTAGNPNISLSNPGTVAASIANNSVATAANVVGNATGNSALQHVTPSNAQTSGVTTDAISTVTEAAVLTAGNNIQALVMSINSTTLAAASSFKASSTPASYSPTAVSVINNPIIQGYQLSLSASSTGWNVSTFQLSFSDDMVASTSGSPTYGHSVLNPENYTSSLPGCTPTSYTSRVVTFACGSLPPGTYQVTINQADSIHGILASATSLGLPADATKTFALPTPTGSTGGTGSGGTSLTLF